MGETWSKYYPVGHNQRDNTLVSIFQVFQIAPWSCPHLSQFPAACENVVFCLWSNLNISPGVSQQSTMRGILGRMVEGSFPTVLVSDSGVADSYSTVHNSTQTVWTYIAIPSSYLIWKMQAAWTFRHWVCQESLMINCFVIGQKFLAGAFWS